MPRSLAECISMTVDPRDLATDLDTGSGYEPVTEAYLLCRSPDAVRVITLAEGDTAVVGREATAEISTLDTRVSRTHARFCLRGGVLSVEDTGSRNGTHVDASVLRGASTTLRAGQTVRVGPIEVHVARSPGVDAPAASAPEAAATTSGDALEALLEADGLVVADPPSLHALGIVRRVAKTDATVLVTGETGVGKEVFAALIHRLSARAEGPYVRLNCAAIPATLLEAELFGHERGAFTGADRRRAGYFEVASGGTLLLDEIGDMPLEIQAKLLRVLEERAVTRLGTTDPVPVDVRVLASTHRDLTKAVEEGTFRRDLFYRIATFTLPIPPLRDRRTEIVLLAERFARRFARRSVQGREETILQPDAVAALLAYKFPGNVRELRNAIEFAAVMADGGVVRFEHLPPSLTSGAAPSTMPPTVRDRLGDLEKNAIEAALRETGGNRTHAALRLGMSRRGLLYKLHKYGLR